MVGNVEVKVKHKGVEQSTLIRDGYCNKYSVVCTNKDTGVQISFPFYGSVYDYYNNVPEYRGLLDIVIECIQSDYYYDADRFPSFEDFANEFGYEQDRDSEKIYKRVIKHAEKLQRVFDSDLIASLEIEFN